ncbi:MAG: PD-(D/E)XK nuclease family protein [Candidatus Methanoplasma sp.]|jgi:hypothetical protein|nr:PD-(D/E)XK nuclease family protein [Candidatus Methanoplasma sp.]
MRRAKSIDELYGEVRGFDIVITSDAALATALNARIDVCRIGGFAYTPRLIAAREAVTVLGEGVWSDLRIIYEISKEAGYDLKTVHSEVENIRNIRRYTKDVAKHLHSVAAHEIYRSFSAMPTQEKAMDRFDADKSEFFAGKRIAVIADDDLCMFDDLDKHFIPGPGKFTEIDMFTEGDFEIPEIRLVGNDRQLAENAMDLIAGLDPSAIAIVMDSSGPIADAVRSAMYRRKIQFKNTMAVRDLSQVRDFLQFLSLALSFSTIRIKHVRELFASYGAFIRSEDDGYLLSKRMSAFHEGKAREVAETMRDIREHTFSEVCDSVVDPKHRPQIKILLKETGSEEERVTSKRVNEIVYAVNNVEDLSHNEQIPDDEKEGVLLADCRCSVYVDRPFVIFLGMGPEWDLVSIGKGYIDREREAEVNAVRFATLVQQGSSAIFAVNTMRGGREARPSPVFEQIYEFLGDGRKVASFADMCSSDPVMGQWYDEKEVKRPEMGEYAPDDPMLDWKFSKSTYNSYFKCPRAFMFGEFLRSPDSMPTVLGSIVHDFAEFYLCYPDIVKENGLGHYNRLIEDRFSGLSSEIRKDLDSCRIRICMDNIVRFIDSLKISNVPLDAECGRRKYKNVFMEIHGCERYSSMTETAYAASHCPLHGKFDLISDGRVVDYKTGPPSGLDVSHSTETILKRMLLRPGNDMPEFQPMIYLYLLKSNGVKPPWRFSLFYAEDNIVGSVTDETFSVACNVKDVLLLEETLAEFVMLSDVVKSEFGKAYDNITCKWAAFVGVALSAGLERMSAWHEDEALQGAVLGAVGVSGTKPNGMKHQTNWNLAAAALKKLAKALEPGMFVSGDTIYVPSDTMDTFVKQVGADHLKASSEMLTKFPADSKGECRRCYFYKACTKEAETEEGEGSE